MRITSWNFLHGEVLQPLPEGGDALQESLAALSSDLIALQEVDHFLERSGSQNQCENIARRISTEWWAFAPTIEGTPGESWRKLEKDNRTIVTSGSQRTSGSYGIGIISKIPVRKWLRYELGKSPVGMPLAVVGPKGKLRPLYVRDEPRVALAAVLENGWTLINTHLSFVPIINHLQLLRLSSWAKKIEREYSTQVILVGDFNLPWGIPSKITRWKRATKVPSYPSWSPKISFDYILVAKKNLPMTREIPVANLPVSDHRAVSIELQ